MAGAVTVSTTEAIGTSFDYLEALYQRPIAPPEVVGLRRIGYLLARLGNPHESFRSVHITGTCGKGSTATMISSVLVRAAHKTGLFRSPHLETYRDRVVVDGNIIGESDWLTAFQRVRALCDAMEAGTAPGYDLGRVSLFEMMWAVAAVHFATVSVDIAVVEVGVGGRLSATNVLEPEVAVITNVGLDHTKLLGPTEVHIAREKAAIIKSSGAATTAADQPNVLDIIEERALRTGSTLWQLGRDVNYEIEELGLSGARFRAATPLKAHEDLRIPMLGAHQVTNAVTAVSAIDLLVDRGFDVPSDATRDGLASVRFPGRFEIVSTQPVIVLDGAHNVASAQALRKTLDNLFPDRQIVLLMGVLGDKDASGIVSQLAPPARASVVTAPPWEARVGDLSRVESSLREHIANVMVVPDPEKALQIALEKTSDQDMLVVTGSLYLVSIVRSFLKDLG